MKTEFKQIRGANSRKFILTSDKITVETKTLRKNNKYEIKLDFLGFDIHYQSDNTLPGKIFLGVCFIWIVGSTLGYLNTEGKESGFWIFNAILGVLMACFAYFKQHQDDIYLVGGQTNLVFYRDIPNEQAVLEFIETVKIQARSYLKEKYTVFDNSTPEQDFYGRINWLREREVISYSEYIEFKTNYDTQKLL